MRYVQSHPIVYPVVFASVIYTKQLTKISKYKTDNPLLAEGSINMAFFTFLYCTIILMLRQQRFYSAGSDVNNPYTMKTMWRV